MKWGDKLEMLELMVETTGNVPPALQQRPELTDSQSALYKAFIEMATCRAYSQTGPAPLTLTSLLDYCNLYDVGREDAQDLWRMVRALDAHWLEEVAARNPAPAKTTSNKR
jgi:hypothetical protein